MWVMYCRGKRASVDPTGYCVFTYSSLLSCNSNSGGSDVARAVGTVLAG